MKSSICQSMLHIHFKCLCKVSNSWEDERQHCWEQRLKEQQRSHPGSQRGEGEASLCRVTETLSLPLQRAGTPWLHRRQAAVSQSTKLRAQSTSEWWKPSASFNLKLLGWSWHPHKNNTYYVVSISSRSPGWLNDNSYLTEHWKLLLHLIVDVSITNSPLGE